MKSLQFKRLIPGFSLERAECELGDFRVWYSEETWWWALNEDAHSYGSEETLEDAKIACQNYYESVVMKADLERFCRAVLDIAAGKGEPSWFISYNGLCTNALFFDDEFDTQVYSALRNIFKGDSYPFNLDQNDYNNEANGETLYSNKRRLAFLRTHARIK